MLPISITTRAWTPASPERVLAVAREFWPARRERTWPNVSAQHLEVHAQGDCIADVTEGTMALGIWWERCRYDWSQSGVVTATVTDSNVYHPELSGFVWRARERGTGSEVEMTIYRDFRPRPKGLAAAALYWFARSRWLSGMQRHVLRAIESEAAGEAARGREAATADLGA